MVQSGRQHYSCGMIGCIVGNSALLWRFRQWATPSNRKLNYREELLDTTANDCRDRHEFAPEFGVTLQQLAWINGALYRYPAVSATPYKFEIKLPELTMKPI